MLDIPRGGWSTGEGSRPCCYLERMARREDGAPETEEREAPVEDAPSGKAVTTDEDEKLPEDQQAMQPDSDAS